MDDARAEARRCRHHQVDAVHLVRALLRAPSVVGALTVRAVSVALVNEGLEARLAELPAVTSYRDGAEVELSASVQAALRGRIPLRWIRAVTAVALFDDLVRAGPMREVVARSAFGPTPIDELMRGAAAAAASRAHRNVLVEHVLCALLDRPAMANAIRHLRRDVGQVRKDLDARLHSGFVSKRLADRKMLLLLASVRANSTGARALESDSIVVKLVREHLGETLEALDLPAFDLLYAFVQGRALDLGLVDAPRVEIWLHNDDHTTMEAVVHVLTEAFGVEDGDAVASMRRVHLQGSALVGRFARADAQARIARAMAICRERMMPLRIEAIAAREG